MFFPKQTTKGTKRKPDQIWFENLSKHSSNCIGFFFFSKVYREKFVPSNSPWPPSEGNKAKRKIVVPANPFWHHQKKKGADPSNSSWPHRKTYIGRWLSLHFLAPSKKIPKSHKLRVVPSAPFYINLSWPHQKLETNWKMVVPSKVFARAQKKKKQKNDPKTMWRCCPMKSAWAPWKKTKADRERLSLLNDFNDFGPIKKMQRKK